MRSALASFALALACVSCADQLDTYTNGTIIVTSRTRSLASKTTKTNDMLGVKFITNGVEGAKVIVQGLIGLATAMYFGLTQLERESTAQLANAGMNEAEIATAKLKLQESLASKGLEGTKAGIAGGLFTPGATKFTQPKL